MSFKYFSEFCLQASSVMMYIMNVCYSVVQDVYTCLCFIIKFDVRFNMTFTSKYDCKNKLQTTTSLIIFSVTISLHIFWYYFVSSVVSSLPIVRTQPQFLLIITSCYKSLEINSYFLSYGSSLMVFLLNTVILKCSTYQLIHQTLRRNALSAFKMK